MSLFSTIFVKKSTVGFLSLDVLVTENLKLPSDVTKYPVEDASEEISDHITRNNEELSITGSVSSSEILSLEFGSCMTKLINAVDQMRSMHKERKPVTVVTGLGKYEDMAFTNLSITRSNGANGGGWLDINADLRKIKKVALKETELPPDKAKDGEGGAKGKTGTSENRRGSSGTENKSPNENSVLWNNQTTIQKYNPFGGGITGPAPQ